MRRILWLVDPNEKASSLRDSSAWLRGLATALKASIQPVHVLGGGAFGIAPEVQAGWLMQLVLETEARIQAMASQLKIPHLLPPRVLSEAYHSRSEAVSGLIDFAREQSADLIVLQGGGARPRAASRGLGGFAETLLLRSRIPVLVIPSIAGSRHKLAVRQKPRRILLALDLSSGGEDACEAVFKEGLSWARRLGASLHLFHALPFASSAAYGPGAFDLGATAAAAVYWSEEAAASRKIELERFAARANRAGVRCTLELETRAIRPSDAVLRAAKREKCDWIAMAGRSGRWSALVLGSVTRMVAREATCPVWIIHYDRREASARKEKAAA